MRAALNARHGNNRLNAKRKYEWTERPIKRELQLKDLQRYESLLLDDWDDDDYDSLDYID